MISWWREIVFWLIICWLCLGVDMAGEIVCWLRRRGMVVWLVGGMVFGLEDV